MMLRPLWTWQRWMAAATPKVFRIALLSAFAPSTMNSRGSLGSSPLGEEIVDQGLDDDRVLRRPLDHGQDMLVAVAIDADRRHQDMVADMQTRRSG